MHEVETSWGRVASIWWLLVWRGLLGGFLVGGVIGFIIGVIGSILGYPQATLVLFTQVVVLPLGLVWGVVVLRMALKKKYRDFRIALLPRNSDHVEVFN